MTDKLVIENKQDMELKKELEKVNWPIDFGSVKLQIRGGHVTLVVVERTIKLD